MTKPHSHLTPILTALATTGSFAAVVGVGWWVWDQVITPLLTVLVWLHVIVQP
ncbi:MULTISPECIES: hypothetical protein [Boudabousia]|uniref:hypothetical protein n=1 Tax=Boudabousia TaxID=2767318 RepID=UPI000AEA66D9|nr:MULTISPECIES: hypothetical protein [Boudabousia]